MRIKRKRVSQALYFLQIFSIVVISGLYYFVLNYVMIEGHTQCTNPPILRGLKAVMINSLNPQFIGEVNSWTQTCDFSHLVASTCCRTKARPLN